MIVLCVFGFYMFVLVCVIPTSVLLLSLFCRVICFVVVIIVSKEEDGVVYHMGIYIIVHCFEKSFLKQFQFEHD